MGEAMRPLFVPMIAVVVPQLSGSLIIFGSTNRIPQPDSARAFLRAFLTSSGSPSREWGRTLGSATTRSQGGSPPREWGQRSSGLEFTPTRVGTAQRSSGRAGRRTVHPHASGDSGERGVTNTLGEGSTSTRRTVRGRKVPDPSPGPHQAALASAPGPGGAAHP